VFRIRLDGSCYEIIKDFGVSAGDGANPEGGVIIASDGALYGATYAGGSNNIGTIFKLNKDGSQFKTVHSFSSTDGELPRGALLEASDGYLYGTTYGAQTGGTVFRLAKDGNGFVALRTFSTAQSEKVDARNPIAGVIEGSDGYLYGTS